MGILQYLNQTREALSGGFNELKNTSGGILRFLGNNVNKFEQKKQDFYEPVPNKVRTRDVIREATELVLPTPTNKAEYLQEMAFNAIPFGATTKSVRNVARETKPLVNKGFTGFKDLTTKFLDYSKGKTTLSKQEILDFANRPELKRGEADLLNRLGSDIKDAKIPAQEFADSIRRDLLELKPVKVKEPQYYNTSLQPKRKYEEMGDFQKSTGYEEVVFESPIVTNGSSHFPNSKNYFAHARGDEVVEGGKKIWREQEIQSDLLQKDNLDRLKNIAERDYMQGVGGVKERDAVKQLDPFTNDRFGERIMRERIKEKAIKGYDKYRLPTGETIGKIEGFAVDDWIHERVGQYGLNQTTITRANAKELVKVGEQLKNSRDGSEWIITDILGDGRFMAVRKDTYVRNFGNTPFEKLSDFDKSALLRVVETFDLTGKSNPQYRRYENWGKFLKNKYGAKLVTDPQGNTWYEIDLKPEYKKLPVEAFGLAGAGFGLSSIFNKDK